MDGGQSVAKSIGAAADGPIEMVADSDWGHRWLVDDDGGRRSPSRERDHEILKPML